MSEVEHKLDAAGYVTGQRSVFCVDGLYTPRVQADVERAKMAAAGHTTGARERATPRWEPENRWEPEHDAALAAAPCDPCEPKVTGPEVWQQSNSAHSICSRAAQIVAGDRAAQHGPKERNHRNIAILWNAFMKLKLSLGYSEEKEWYEFDAWDVATMMELLKIARRFAGAGRTNPDNYVDGAGYCGVAGEIALNGGES